LSVQEGGVNFLSISNQIRYSLQLIQNLQDEKTYKYFAPAFEKKFLPAGRDLFLLLLFILKNLVS